MPEQTNLLERVAFRDPRWRAYAERFSDRLGPFVAGGVLADESTGWENVFAHCLSEALSARALAEAIRNEQPQLLELAPETYELAALYHDAYKRREIEQLQAQPQSLDLLYRTDNEAKDWLKGFAVSDDVLELQGAFGNNAALQIFRGERSDFGSRMLHYVDDITQGDELVSLSDRLSALEGNPKYAEQNEWSRQLFDGQTLYGAKRQFNGETEQEIATVLGLESPAELPAWIRAAHDRLLAALTS